LPVENVHLDCEGTSKLWLYDGQGEAIVENYCRQIELCADLGISAGIAHVTYGADFLPPGEKGIRRYERLVECAEKQNFTLCVENSRASDHLNYVLDHIQSPNVRFCYDSGHDFGMGFGTPYYNQYLPRYKDRLAALHIHDTIVGYDMHMAPYDGALDWDLVARELSETDYGMQKLCAEPGGQIYGRHPEMTESQLREEFGAFSIADDRSLVRYHDGYYTVYEDFSFEQLLERFLSGMKKLAEKMELYKADNS